jgi:excisionase family DNA binding protein
MNGHKELPAALYDFPGAAAYLGGISRSTLKALASSGTIRSVTIGRRRLFPRAELDRYVADRLDAGQ